tara:strand:+ start:1292 stop:2425 length:1134 start_codon:yes stop_codon:yes gene_type:complete
MTPAQIADICDGRDKAIALWLGLYDTYHATRDEAARLTLGGALSLSCGRDWTEDTLTRAFIQSQPIEQRDKETGARQTIAARDNFERVLTHTMDRRCWAALMEQLGFDQLLDQQARKEFHDGLRDDPVPFTPDNCAATFGNIWTNRRDLYLRGIANVFAKLDRRFRSHNGFKIGARLIIDRALNEWGSWDRYERRDTLRDVERVFLELDEKPPVSEGHSIASQVADSARVRGSLPTVIEGDYFRVRVFKNGNLHIWFERDDLLQSVNLLLAEYYGEAIGDGYEGAFAGGGGILRQARPDSRREILLVAAFYGRARKATAQFYPAMATHFEGVWPNAPILNEAERTPKSLCRFIRFQHGQPNLCGTSRSGPAFDRRVN